MNEEIEVMRAVLEHSDQIVAICRKGGSNLCFSVAAEKIFGPPRFIALQEDDAERYGLYYPGTNDLIPTSDLPMARALKGETVRDVLISVRRTGQPKYLVSLHAGPLRDSSGIFYGCVAVGSILDVGPEEAARHDSRQIVISKLSPGTKETASPNHSSAEGSQDLSLSAIFLT